jgi:glycosyltransferase involved in cell wall biosynthesis
VQSIHSAQARKTQSIPLAAMVIAVNSRLLHSKHGGYVSFIREVFTLIARQQPAHEFYFLSDRTFDEAIDIASNSRSLVVGPKADGRLLTKYWFDLRLPKVLKKIRANVFVSPDGFCSLTTKLPQCLIAPGMAFSNLAGKSLMSDRFSGNISRFLNKAETVVAITKSLKEQILENYKIKEEKLEIVYPAPRNIFGPVDVAAQSEIKDKYTEGKEFFIVSAPMRSKDDLVNLLKAFSIFKKRQQSTMKLVLATESPINNLVTDLVKTYKYKEEVVILPSLEEQQMASLVSSAYASVCPFAGFGFEVLEAMRSGTPVLVCDHPAVREIASDAVIFFNENDHTDLAEKLMLIYKNEEIRNRLIDRGNEVQKNYTMEKAAASLWQVIQKSCSQNEDRP